MSKIAIILLMIISVMLQYKLWFRADGMRGIIKINQEIKQQEIELSHLRNRNTRLLDNIRLLKQNPNTIEEHARVVFGMIKKDETYYRVIE